MASSPLRNPYVAPLMLWSSLATKTTEMMLASAQVIGHRSGRMARAGAAPSARDRREFARMGQEKIEAAAQCAQAMAAQLLSANAQLVTQMLANMQRGTLALASLAASRTPAQALARQAALARAVEQSASSVAGVSKSAARLVRSGLNPIHAKATANARRLARR